MFTKPQIIETMLLEMLADTSSPEPDMIQEDDTGTWWIGARSVVFGVPHCTIYELYGGPSTDHVVTSGWPLLYRWDDENGITLVHGPEDAPYADNY